ncbi:MAG: hypothetical protein GQ560_05780 [Dehalococcoidia bacterium]|nr:hypothetical protein [Dehalococcoidia bacterium]
MTHDPFIGTWRLLSYEIRGADGEIKYPWGQDPVGLLIYSGDGYMSVAMMSASRTRFTDKDVKKGTNEEKATAVDTYVSYSGRYEINEDTVTHHVEVSLFPNWVGNDQKRTFQFDGNRLTLSTPLPGGDMQRSAHLVWEHV